jgi:hypothetical protein
MIRDLLAEGANADAIRNDIQPGELASFWLYAHGSQQPAVKSGRSPAR